MVKVRESSSHMTIHRRELISFLEESILNCTPRYKWDRTFNLIDFKKALDDHNRQESTAAGEADWYIRGRDKKPIPAARITYGDSVDQVLLPEHDIIIPLRLDESFMKFANTQILVALEKAKKAAQLAESDCEAPLTLIHASVDSEPEVHALWRLNKILNWQMLDRRIDECAILFLSIQLAQ